MARTRQGWWVGIVVVAALLTQGCRYPRDIEKTLEDVRGGVLDVGRTENSPWAIRTDPGSYTQLTLPTNYCECHTVIALVQN